VALSLLLTLTGCDSIQIRAAFNPAVQEVSGLVSTVTISTASDGGAIVTVTILNLQRSGSDDFTTTTFCGNHVSQFPLGSQVQVNFTPGSACSTIIAIIVG
jgi:hypothetical protein